MTSSDIFARVNKDRKGQIASANAEKHEANGNGTDGTDVPLAHSFTEQVETNGPGSPQYRQQISEYPCVKGTFERLVVRTKGVQRKLAS